MYLNYIGRSSIFKECIANGYPMRVSLIEIKLETRSLQIALFYIANSDSILILELDDRPN